MKKFVVFFLLSSVHFLTFSQEHQNLNTQEALVANKVYRMDEYDGLDSAAFKQEFPNGYYSIFNEEGLVIKANNYYSYDFSGEEPKHDEYINYSFYDENDQRIGFIQQFTKGDEPFRIISLKSISEDEETVQYASIEPSFLGYKVEFDKRDYNAVMSSVGDTVEITPTHHRAYGVRDSSFMLDIFYSRTSGLIDSTIYHNKCLGKVRSEKCQSKFFYTYDENGNIVSKRMESHSNTSEINPYRVRTASYNEKGLVETLETNYRSSSINDREVRKFVYTFREED
ncbi:MAG: hypothetical protein HWE22_15320 [Flavobacteriales bacterium]|nr:hypothetical protein [Flavobacteriales bacterium]